MSYNPVQYLEEVECSINGCQESDDEIEKEVATGKVTFYCTNCGHKIRTVSWEDTPPLIQARLTALFSELEE